jgi:hypothetical protein
VGVAVDVLTIDGASVDVLSGLAAAFCVPVRSTSVSVGLLGCSVAAGLEQAARQNEKTTERMPATPHFRRLVEILIGSTRESEEV